MKFRHSLYLAAAGAAAVLLTACNMGGSATAQSRMGFFVTSVNPGKGADFGGLAARLWQ